MSYIGSIGEKVTLDVTLVNIYEWIDYSFNYRGTPRRIYTFNDENGNVLVWKTSKCISIEAGKDRNGNDIYYVADKGDKLNISGTVKDHSTYKEVEQTELQRVKFSFIERAVSYNEKKAAKQKDQLATLSGGDFIWVMPYKQYKEHYSDCETIYGSYDDHKESRDWTPATIEVIIREGRLKPSGVRGEHYSGYQMENELGEKITYRAVSEENALKRVTKDFPNNTWTCCHIFNYRY